MHNIDAEEDRRISNYYGNLPEIVGLAFSGGWYWTKRSGEAIRQHKLDRLVLNMTSHTEMI